MPLMKPSSKLRELFIKPRAILFHYLQALLPIGKWMFWHCVLSCSTRITSSSNNQIIIFISWGYILHEFENGLSSVVIILTQHLKSFGKCWSIFSTLSLLHPFVSKSVPFCLRLSLQQKSRISYRKQRAPKKNTIKLKNRASKATDIPSRVLFL